MKAILASLVVCLLLSSCGDRPFDKVGNVDYLRGGEACGQNQENHWLLDMQARSSKDSLYMNTLEMKGKFEMHRLQLDTTSDVVQLLSETCKGDSIRMQLQAIDFYSSFYGQVPEWLPENERIEVKIWVHDKLTDLQHISYKRAFESHQMAQYIEDHKWNAKRDSETEIYFEKLKKTNSEVERSDKLLVSYVIQNLKGDIISRSRPEDPLVYVKGDKDVLKGIKYILNNLSEGESARALVPSHQAYGESGIQVGGITKLAGYAPVIIEMEVLKTLE